MASWVDQNMRLKLMIIQKYFKPRYLFLPLLVLFSCDPSGNVFLTNGYSDTIVIVTQYNFKGKILESRDILSGGTTFCVDARHSEYRFLISIKIETIDGEKLIEYSPAYLMQIRNAYKKEGDNTESWIFTDKGLFLKALEVSKKNNFNSEKIIMYYRSDEAIEELTEKLKHEISTNCS